MKNTKFISINDKVKLWVETFGAQTGEGCILISGAGANSSFWSDRFCNQLVKEGFYVVKYDHRDIGYSTKINWDTDPYEFNVLCEDVIVLMNALNINKAHIIGHSMGGFIVQILGLNNKERIISITSISSSTNSPDVPEPPEETWKIFVANSPTNNLDNDLEGFLKVWEYLNGTAGFEKDMAIEYTKNLYNRQKVDGPLGASHVLAQHTLSDRTEALKGIKIPALIIHGEEDYLVDKIGGIQTAEAIPNSKLVLIPEMGHIPFNKNLEKSIEDEISKFLINNRAIKSADYQ